MAAARDWLAVETEPPGFRRGVAGAGQVLRRRRAARTNRRGDAGGDRELGRR